MNSYSQEGCEGLLSLVLCREYLDPLQKSLADTFSCKPGDLVHGDMDDPPFVGIHHVQDLVFACLVDMVRDLLHVFPDSPFFSFPVELAVRLDSFGRDLIQDMLESHKQGSVFPQEEILVSSIKNEVDYVAFVFDLVLYIQGKKGESLVEELRDPVIFRLFFRPGSDDNLFAPHAEELGFFGNDFIIEFAAGQLEHMLGLAYDIFQVLPLEFLLLVIFFFFFHEILSFVFVSSGS